MDLFSSNDTDELTLKDLPRPSDLEVVQEWQKRRNDAQAELGEAKDRLEELKERQRRRRMAGVGSLANTAMDRLREFAEEGSLDDRIDEARRNVARKKLALREIKQDRSEVMEEALDQIRETADDLMGEALTEYIEALRRFDEARDRLQTLDVWIDRVNAKLGIRSVDGVAGPLEKPYTFKGGIPGLDSPITADQLADNLESDA